MEKVPERIVVKFTQDERDRIEALREHHPFYSDAQILRVILGKGMIALEKELGIK